MVQGILTHFLVFFRYTYGKPVDGRVLVKFSMVGGRFKDVLVKEIPDQVTGVERRSYIHKITLTFIYNLDSCFSLYLYIYSSIYYPIYVFML